MPKKFAGKVAVVTGGSTGMGLATRSGLSKRGWTTFSLPAAVKTHWMLPSLKLERA